MSCWGFVSLAVMPIERIGYALEPALVASLAENIIRVQVSFLITFRFSNNFHLTNRT